MVSPAFSGFAGPSLEAAVKKDSVDAKDGHPDHCCWETGLSFKVKGDTPFQSKSGDKKTCVTFLHHGLGTHDMARLMNDDSKLIHPHTKKQLTAADITRTTFYKCRWEIEGMLSDKKKVQRSGVADKDPQMLENEGEGATWVYLTVTTSALEEKAAGAG
jgi:hypothetical protein